MRRCCRAGSPSTSKRACGRRGTTEKVAVDSMRRPPDTGVSALGERAREAQSNRFAVTAPPSHRRPSERSGGGPPNPRG
nr:unnamed protein product [Digitaria exilis]CAB3500409.1 unnamed protein product [Digitaria exilis]